MYKAPCPLGSYTISYFILIASCISQRTFTWHLRLVLIIDSSHLRRKLNFNFVCHDDWYTAWSEDMLLLLLVFLYCKSVNFHIKNSALSTQLRRMFWQRWWFNFAEILNAIIPWKVAHFVVCVCVLVWLLHVCMHTYVWVDCKTSACYKLRRFPPSLYGIIISIGCAVNC